MILGILGPGGNGGTFLDWSINFALGNHKTLWFDARGSKNQIGPWVWRDLAQDPLTGKNAHNHRAVHPDSTSVDQTIEALSQHDQSVMYTFYYVDDLGNGRHQHNHHTLVDRYADVLFVECLYQPRHIDEIFCYQMEKMPSGLSHWQHSANMDHADPSDLRERLALFYPLSVCEQLTFRPRPHGNVFFLDHGRIMNDLDQAMLDILAWLGKRWVSPEQQQHWLSVYQRWRLGCSRPFFDDIDQILQAIVAGRPMDLSGYGMTLAKETILISRLLFDHNLAIQGQDHVSLPSDTMGWHALLEPNVYHCLTIDPRKSILDRGAR
jgi:hypothetical protein